MPESGILLTLFCVLLLVVTRVVGPFRDATDEVRAANYLAFVWLVTVSLAYVIQFVVTR